jgi:hypothetical protein
MHVLGPSHFIHSFEFGKLKTSKKMQSLQSSKIDGSNFGRAEARTGAGEGAGEGAEAVDRNREGAGARFGAEEGAEAVACTGAGAEDDESNVLVKSAAELAGTSRASFHSFCGFPLAKSTKSVRSKSRPIEWVTI